MGKMKDIAIDNMNKPDYEVSIMAPDGPDDFIWEMVYASKEYMDAIKAATEYHENGAKVKLFDPYLGEEYNFPKDF